MPPAATRPPGRSDAAPQGALSARGRNEWRPPSRTPWRLGADAAVCPSLRPAAGHRCGHGGRQRSRPRVGPDARRALAAGAGRRWPRRLISPDARHAQLYALSTITAGAVRPAVLEFGLRRRWPDIGRVQGANAGPRGTVVAREGPEGQGNSPSKGVWVRPFNPPVVGSSPTGPTRRTSLLSKTFRDLRLELSRVQEPSWPEMAGYRRP